jgi:hypothetical protein
MLQASANVGYIHEPFNVHRWPNWVPLRLPHVYMYVCSENEHLYEGALEDVLSFRYPIGNIVGAPNVRQVRQALAEFGLSLFYRTRRMRPLLKDPIALMSAEWLSDRFGMDTVVMLRHPAAFASSIKRLSWRFDFENWRDQPLLVRDLIGPFEGQIAEFADREHDLIDQAILMWNVTHHVIRGYRERHAEWAFIRHEDLSEEPLKGYRELYDKLDLTWDRFAEDWIVRASTDSSRKEVPTYLHRTVVRDSRAARWTWLKRLTQEEQRRVREGTAEVAEGFYGDDDWTPPREVLA